MGRNNSFFFFFFASRQTCSSFALGWEITVKLQQEGFGPLNILKLCGCLAAINAGGEKTTLFPAIKFVQLSLRQQTLLWVLFWMFFHVLNTAGRCSYLGNSGGMLLGGRALFWEGGHGKVGFAGSGATLEAGGWWQVKQSQGRGCSMPRL